MRIRILLSNCFAIFLIFGFFNSAGFLWAQQGALAGGSAPTAAVDSQQGERNLQVLESSKGSAPLLIGPGDELEIVVYGAPDLSAHARVESEGNVVLPLIGSLSLAGDTSSQAGKKIEDKLREASLIKNPRVSVYVKEYTSAGISVVGQVNKPGVYPALGPHRLFDVLQAAGGPSVKAANSVTVSRRDDPEHPISVNFSKDPAQMARSNFDLQPGDTVVVPEAGIVYVLGEVNKPGGFVMNSSGGVTVLQVIAAAGGPTRMASFGGTKIIRSTPSGLHEVAVPLKPLLSAKIADLPIEAGDILYVPNSRAKSALAATTSLINSAGSAAIYRLP